MIRPWIYENEIRTADDLQQTISSAIDSSGVVVAILSEHTKSSTWVMFELQNAYEKGIKILPVIVNLNHRELLKEIQERHYIVLHDRSTAQMTLVAQRLCKDIADYIVESDQLLRAVQDLSYVLQAAAIKEGEGAAAVNTALLRFLPKLLRSVYYKEYAGIDCKEYPPDWLVVSVRSIVEIFKIRDLSRKKRTSPQLLSFIENYEPLIGQCLFIGYYAMSLRRPISNIAVKDEFSYDVDMIMATFDEVAAQGPNPGLDVEVWNMCLHHISEIYVLLAMKKIIPKDEDIEEILTKAMFYGYTLARVIERLALRMSGVYR